MKDKEKANKELHSQDAEEQLKLHANKPGDIFTTESDMLKLIHELQVHQIELELQNNELSQATLALQESETKYRQLAESSTTLVYRMLLKPDYS
jgi:hypothetical protein